MGTRARLASQAETGRWQMKSICGWVSGHAADADGTALKDELQMRGCGREVGLMHAKDRSDHREDIRQARWLLTLTSCRLVGFIEQ